MSDRKWFVIVVAVITFLIFVFGVKSKNSVKSNVNICEHRKVLNSLNTELSSTNPSLTISRTGSPTSNVFSGDSEVSLRMQ